MSYEYPTNEHLQTIKTWDISIQRLNGFLEYIEALWWCPEFGFKLTGKRVLRLELHTGGWSGNEEIIGALYDNLLFWTMYWVKSTRGGHYYFRIPRAQTLAKETQSP